MNIRLFIFRIFFLCSFFIPAFSHSAQAATLFVAPSNSQGTVGEHITVTIKIDSEGTSLNAAQAVIRFPKDTLQVVSLDTTQSVFNFWLEGPSFSNADGIISFTGGTPYGVSGNSVQILNIVFAAKGSGSGILALSDAAITASDGSGTNILSKTVDGSFAIVPKKEIGPVSVPPPSQIIRTPIPTGKLPLKPAVNIALYPDEVRWYNLVSQFNASWELPLDVSGVSAVVNKQPNFIPTELDGLFDAKTFAALSEGISYLHVRFRNDFGWGPTAHYRLAIDTKPPLGFDVSVTEGELTDNPTPTLQFKTNDALSGLKEYRIQVGDGDVIKIPANEFTGSYKLSVQSPGKHPIVVRAFDQAENSTEDRIILETIPIPSPAITAVNKELFQAGRGLEVEGSAAFGDTILYALKQKNEMVVKQGEVSVDENGNWFVTVTQPFRQGDYFVEVVAKDRRGALSLAVRSESLRSNIGTTSLIIEISVVILFLILALSLLPWLPESVTKRVPLFALFRSKADHFFKLLFGDHFQHYSGSLEELKKGFDYLHDQVVITDSHGAIVYINKSSEKVTGFSCEEMIGKNPGELWGGNMPEEFYQNMWHTIKVKKEPFIGKMKNKRKDGTWYWQELRISPVLDEREEVKYFIGIEPEVKNS